MSIATASVVETEQQKYLQLREILREKLADGLIVAFSGGVDSSFLLWAAEQERRSSGGELLALTTLSESFSQAERADAESFIKALGIDHVWRESREIENAQYVANGLDRCFHCKTELFRICREEANNLGYKWIAYGFNASDRGDHRPGHIAAKENSILSPLDEVGLTKDEIRTLMRENNLSIAEKPASPCLSSRLMTGVSISREKLKDVEEIESILRDGGLKIFRVRVHEDGAKKFLRLEVSPDEIEKAVALRETLVNEGMKRGYAWVTLDLAGYKTGGGNLPTR